MKSIQENTLRQQSEQASSAEEVYEKMIKRLESEQKRYKELYKINNTDKSQYDLIIDTDKNNLAQVVDIVLNKYKSWLTEK